MWRSGFVGFDDDFAREKNVKVVGTNVISFESVLNLDVTFHRLTRRGIPNGL